MTALELARTARALAVRGIQPGQLRQLQGACGAVSDADLLALGPQILADEVGGDLLARQLRAGRARGRSVAAQLEEIIFVVGTVEHAWARERAAIEVPS